MRTRIFVASAMLALAAGPALAKDKVRIVDSQPMVFAHFGIYHAQAEGYFDAENLDVSVIVGRGGADALQAVVTGSQDMVMFPGILSVIAAYAKGAPVTIVASGCLGAPETYWYVKSDSPIRSFKDLDGKDLVYSNPGSLSHLTVQTLAREAGVRPKFVSVGTFAASRTQMMSGQTDTAYTGMPANYEMIRKGEARMIGSGADSPTLNGMTTRVVVVNTAWLAKNKDAAVRTLRAVWKGHLYNFSAGDKAFARYAEHWKVDLEDVKKMYDFYTLDHVRFAPVLKLDESLALAQDYGFIKEPLTAEQMKGLLTPIYVPGR